MMMLPFSIFCAAVFAEPSVAEIEEVIGLVHGWLSGAVRLLDGPAPDSDVASILENPPWCWGLRLKALAPRLAGRCA
jgi:hypothetical protein